MKSGLYAVPGDSAAARAAACAKRFDGPITKLSKVYLSLSPDIEGWIREIGEGAAGGGEPLPRCSCLCRPAGCPPLSGEGPRIGPGSLSDSRSGDSCKSGSAANSGDTTRRQETRSPSTSPSASWMIGWKRVSIQSLAKSEATPITNASSEKPRPLVDSNQMRYVPSLRRSRMIARALSQISPLLYVSKKATLLAGR